MLTKILQLVDDFHDSQYVTLQVKNVGSAANTCARQCWRICEGHSCSVRQHSLQEERTGMSARQVITASGAATRGVGGAIWAMGDTDPVHS